MCRKRAPVCQVCSVDLVALKIKPYCIKKRACPEHMAADAVTIPGRQGMYRFCHQCGRFEPLACFDGMRRSCRTRLGTRRVRPASKSLADGGSPGMSASEAFAAAAAYGAAAAAAASAPASSPAVGLNAAASPAPAHSCSVLSVDAAPMQLCDQQGWPHSAAAGVALSPSLQHKQLQQIMQQGAAAQPPAAVSLGAVSAPVSVQAAVQSGTLQGGTAPASTAAGLGRTASTCSAMFGAAAAATALSPDLQAGSEDNASAGIGADMDLIERAALRRQQLLLQAKQLLEEERQLRELASSTSDAATARLTGALLAQDLFAPNGNLATMQPGSIADGSAGELLARPLALPGAASRLLVPGTLELPQQQQWLLPRVAAAAPLTEDGTGEGPSDIYELRRQLQQATAQVQELQAVVSSTVRMMSGGVA